MFGRFFQAVLLASLLTLAGGVWRLARVAMVAIFTHIRFVLYTRLSQPVAASVWAAGSAALAQIRSWVSIKPGLGILVLVVTLMRCTS